MAATQTTTKSRARWKTATPPTPTTTEDAAAHVAELDALLDEIDEVLEENAEAFVKGYVQRGGE